MKKLFSDVLLYGIVHFGTAGISFIMLPLYTNYFSPESFGLWDVSFTVITLLLPLVACELNMATYRWLLEENKNENHQQIITTGFYQLLKQIGIFSIIAIILNLLVTFPYQWHAFIVIDVMLISGFMQQTARGLGKNHLFALLGLLQAITVAVVNVIGIFILHGGIEFFFIGYIIANLLMLGIAWYQLQFHTFLQKSLFSRALLRNLFAYALPIIPAAASWSLMSMSDRLMIALYMGTGANGIYAVSLKVASVLMMANTIFSLAWKDTAIRLYTHTDRRHIYSKVFRHYFRLMALTALLLTVLAKPLISIWIGDAYVDAWQYVGILLAATLFHACGLFWSAGFHGAKQTKVIFSTTLVGAILNISLNLFLLPVIGLYAAAISSLIAFLVTWLIRVKKATRFFKIDIAYKDVVAFTVLMVLVVWFQGNG